MDCTCRILCISDSFSSVIRCTLYNPLSSFHPISTKLYGKYGTRGGGGLQAIFPVIYQILKIYGTSATLPSAIHLCLFYLTKGQTESKTPGPLVSFSNSKRQEVTLVWTVKENIGKKYGLKNHNCRSSSAYSLLFPYSPMIGIFPIFLLKSKF